IRDEKQPEHKGRGQARVPGPPDPPDRLGPEWPSYEDTTAKHESHFGRGQGQVIGIARAACEIPETAQEYQKIGHKGGPRAANVQVEDSLHLAHGELLRGVEKNHIKG